MNSPKLKTDASVASYNLDKLMAQTRKLAADYHEQTGHALPVTEELARFDAINLLKLKKLEVVDGVDACGNINVIDPNNADTNHVEEALHQYLIKGRVIFKAGKARQKLGKLGTQPTWTDLLMVLYDPNYQPTFIYSIERHIIDQQMEGVSPDKRGSMTVAKYKAIGQLVWENAEPPYSKAAQSKTNPNQAKKMCLNQAKKD